MRHLLFFLAILIGPFCTQTFLAVDLHAAQNVIVMIGDGVGYNHHRAYSYYNGSWGDEFYDTSRTDGSTTYDWTSVGCTTYAYRGSYDPARIDPASPDHNPYLIGVATDSAASATAWNTGEKTFSGFINVGVRGAILTTVGQHYADAGRSVGTVSSVYAVHATPAAVWTHNRNREMGREIFDEMAYSTADSGLDVVIGTGHPYYDDNGNYRATPYFHYGYFPDQESWEDMTDPNGAPENWTFVDDRPTFQQIADGTTAPPERLFGIAPVHQTLELRRSTPGINPTIPTLDEMSQAALNVLKQNESGFYLQIEGGATDWASHSNDMTGLLGEMGSFYEAIDNVIDWVETNSSWGETLLIVTADHETGMLRGPDYWSDTSDYLVEDRGAGTEPGHRFISSDHTNDIVPLYAIGAGSDLILDYIDGFDTLRSVGYIDNTSIFEVTMSGLTIPEPTGAVMLSILAFCALVAWRRTGR
jgi:alkaline phosphatase